MSVAASYSMAPQEQRRVGVADFHVVPAPVGYLIHTTFGGQQKLLEGESLVASPSLLIHL